MSFDASLGNTCDDEREYYSDWTYANQQVLYSIFQYLNVRDLLRAGETCSTWHNASMDSLLWKALFYRNLNISRSISIKPGKQLLLQRI